MGGNDPFANGANVSPAGLQDQSPRLNSKRHAKVVDSVYHWVRKRPSLSPGAYNFAFDSLGLVEFEPAGPGFACAQPPRVFTKPYNAIYGVVPVGLGGLISGQMMMQPLYDPNSNSYGGYVLSP